MDEDIYSMGMRQLQEGTSQSNSSLTLMFSLRKLMESVTYRCEEEKWSFGTKLLKKGR
jgi:hypothetical protein